MFPEWRTNLSPEKSGRRNKTLRKRRSQKIGFTVDLLGEAVVSEADADEYAARYLDLLEKLARETKTGRTRWAKI
jgi:RHH-type proline utilization regulon transcriptional repressor/proline dehydrogenase/delta 1-pyrroline-5-carboxylate dehydrogenase